MLALPSRESISGDVTSTLTIDTDAMIAAVIITEDAVTMRALWTPPTLGTLTETSGIVASTTTQWCATIREALFETTVDASESPLMHGTIGWIDFGQLLLVIATTHTRTSVTHTVATALIRAGLLFTVCTSEGMRTHADTIDAEAISVALIRPTCRYAAIGTSPCTVTCTLAGLAADTVTTAIIGA